MLAASGSPDYAALAAALAMMVGVLLVAGGVFRLGWIADLLSIPVTTGFLVGISFHILVSQFPGILGISVHDGGPMLHRLAVIIAALPAANPITILIGLGVLAIIVVLENIDARIPSALIGLVLASLAVVLFALERRGVTVLADISVSLPALALPDITFGRFTSLLSLGLIIAIVTMVQTAATTRSFPSDADRPPDVDRDFIGVGVGSILAGLIGAFPVNASPPRTAIVSETGGRSQLAGLVAVGVIAALMTFGVAVLRHVPNAALSGVLLFVALRIVRVRQIVTVWRQSQPEFWLIVATAGAIIVLPIEQGVGIGIALSLLHGIWSTTRAHVLLYERVPGTSIWWPLTPSRAGEHVPGVVVVGFPAPLSFLNADRFRRDFLAALMHDGARPRVAVLEATGIVEIDFTAAQALNEIIRRCREDRITFAIARLESERAQAALTRFGVLDLLGPERLFQSADEAVRSLAEGSPHD